MALFKQHIGTSSYYNEKCINARKPGMFVSSHKRPHSQDLLVHLMLRGMFPSEINCSSLYDLIRCSLQLLQESSSLLMSEGEPPASVPYSGVTPAALAFTAPKLSEGADRGLYVTTTYSLFFSSSWSISQLQTKIQTRKYPLCPC